MQMDNRIRDAFGQVRAEEKLKKDTEAYLERKTGGYRNAFFRSRRLAVSLAAAAMAVAVVVSSYFYAVPAYAISLDADSSLELRVNRMDRVIQVRGRNGNGRRVAQSAKVFFMKYTDALETIMEDADLAGDTAREEDVAITVTGEDDGKSEEMMNVIAACSFADSPHVTCRCGKQGGRGMHRGGMKTDN